MNAQRLLAVIGILGAVVFMVGAGGGKTVSGAEARELVTKQGALLLDVRTPEEFSAGHVDGAVNIPVQELEAKLATFPAKKDQAVVVYCHSGRRSATAAALLTKAGYAKVSDLGAMSNWK